MSQADEEFIQLEPVQRAVRVAKVDFYGSK